LRQGQRHTHAEPVDDTADDHLRQMPRDNLENGADGIADKTERDRPLPAQSITEGKSEDGAAEGSELATARVSIIRGHLES